MDFYVFFGNLLTPFLAIILNPLVRKGEKDLKIKRGFPILMTFLISPIQGSLTGSIYFTVAVTRGKCD